MSSSTPITIKSSPHPILVVTSQMPLTAEELSRLFRVRKTLFKLLQDRNYSVVEDHTKQTFDEFKAKYGALDAEVVIDAMKMVVPLSTSNGADSNNMFVYFSGSDEKTKLTKDAFKTITEVMDANSASRAIIITAMPVEKVNNKFREQVSQYNNEGSNRIELFEFRELIVNITEHVLVPQHVPLSKDQIKELLSNYKLKLTQLPRMQQTDPIAKYYGLTRGDVVKIIRQSETAGRYVTYRAIL